jgi:hypothetical protein
MIVCEHLCRRLDCDNRRHFLAALWLYVNTFVVDWTATTADTLRMRYDSIVNQDLVTASRYVTDSFWRVSGMNRQRIGKPLDYVTAFLSKQIVTCCGCCTWTWGVFVYLLCEMTWIYSNTRALLTISFSLDNITIQNDYCGTAFSRFGWTIREQFDSHGRHLD